MGFRTVVISSRVKLEYKLGYMVCRGETDIKIHVSEISTLIIQSTAVAVTAALLSELISGGVKVIFCDAKCSPQAELLPYYGSYNGSMRILAQTEWNDETKVAVWEKIISRKIYEQAEVLRLFGKGEACRMLIGYAEDIRRNDETNREGHAAKVYFNALFGDSFSREAAGRKNTYLNYGYTVLLSAFNREIVALGYLTQLGIWHKNEYNDFNLACDLMEPFRPTVDRIAVTMDDEDEAFKLKLIDVLNKKTKIGGQVTPLDNAIRIYVRSVIAALNSGNVDGIIFAEEYEL